MNSLWRTVPILALLTVTGVADAEETYDFLEGFDTVTVIREGNRRVFVVGEFHKNLDAPDAAQKYQKYKKVVDDIAARMKTQELVFLPESMLAFPDDVPRTLRALRIDPTTLKGHYRGLENGYVRTWFDLGNAHLAARGLLTFERKPEQISAEDLEGWRDSNRVLGEHVILCMGTVPLLGYWKKLYAEPEIASMPTAGLLDETLKDITRPRVLNFLERRFAGRGIKIPSLAEVLDAHPQSQWSFDIKPTRPSIVERVLHTLRDRNMEEQTVLASFSARTMLEVRARGFRGRTSLALKELYLTFVPPLFRLLPMRGDIASLPLEHEGTFYGTERLIQRCHSCGLQVHFWGVNDLVAAQRLIQLGVDIIETDKPELLAPLL